MAHNFRLTGTFYVSKAGNDENNGTTPDTPFLNLAKVVAGGGSVILGTGTYISPTPAQFGYEAGFKSVIRADGTVKILADAVRRFNRLTATGCQPVDIYFDQYGGFVWCFQQYGNPVVYTRCIFKVVAPNAALVNSACCPETGAAFSDCIFYNVNMQNGDAGEEIGINGRQNSEIQRLSFDRCIFINCRFGTNVASITNSYLDATSSLCTLAANNNNVDPSCNPAQGQGLNVNGAGFSLTSPGGISAAPQFNSVAKEDFTLRAASPHILRGIGPAHKRYANSFYAEFSGSPADTVGLGNTRLRATGTNTVVPLLQVTDATQAFEVNNQGGIVLQANDTSTGFGTFTTGRIPFADIPDEITLMELKAGLNFNVSYPALESQFNMNQPEIFNNNVPDWSNYAPNNAGRNPNRLSYRMRWSTKSNPNADLANVSDWVTGTQFIEFEWNQKPLWNPATGTGNGEPSFDPAAGQAVQCTFYQLQVCLRNNYYR